MSLTRCSAQVGEVIAGATPDGSTLAFVAHYGDEDELWLETLVSSPTATCAYTRMAKTHP